MLDRTATPDAGSLAVDFEDLKVGMAFTSRGRTVTEADVVSFAALSADWNPLHTDAVYAEKGYFGERVAHGMLVLSMATGLAPLDSERIVAVRRADVTFMQPTRLGDTITLHGTITDLSPLDERFGRVSMRWRIVSQRGETLIRARVDLLWKVAGD